MDDRGIVVRFILTGSRELSVSKMSRESLRIIEPPIPRTPKFLSPKVKHRKFFKSRLVTTGSKLHIYRTVIRPTVTYVSETWVLKENIIRKLLVFERKILRGIFGPTKENQTCRIKNNEELDKVIKHENIINYIKAHRLSWFGHIQGMPEARATKKIFKWNPLTTRPR